jgi:hypothetical protein
MKMSNFSKGEKPDYVAMAAVLLRIAKELRQQMDERTSHRDIEQAERLERIAADIMDSVSA